MSRVFVLAIEVGGTHVRLGLADSELEIQQRSDFSTHCNNYPQSLQEIGEAGRTMQGDNLIVAVGVSIAGTVNRGVLTGAGNLHDWLHSNIQLDFAREFDVPVVVLNYTQAGAFGEHQYYEQPLIYVRWDTGIGCALQYHNGDIAYPTEAGHIIIDRLSSLQCGCGGRGHWEALCGGDNIPNRNFGGIRGLRAEMLNNRQWSDVLRDMAVGLRSASTMMPGAPIVLGGGIADHQTGRIDELRPYIDQLVSTCPCPLLFPAHYGVDSGLVGAAACAWQRVGQ